MRNALTRHVHLRTSTPQSEPIMGRDMVENNAGGFVFSLSQWDQLRRFLILGTEGGTYYVKEQALTKENAKVLQACLDADPVRTIDMVVSISTESLAPKNTQVIFALAVASSHDNPACRIAAEAAVPAVCRTGTHLYQYMDFMKGLGSRGWGRSRRRTIASIMENMDVRRLALHSIKYRQRGGWSYRDLLRLSHPKTNEEDRNALFAFMVGKGDLSEIERHGNLSVVEGYLKIKEATSSREAARLIRDYGLPWEAVPSHLRRETAVWEALLPLMGMTAMVRNLATMTRLGMLTPLGETERFVRGRLFDEEAIRRSRAHPMQFLDAHETYRHGGGVGLSRGEPYRPNPNVVSALDQAFRLAFQNVVPSGKRFYLGLDVSGSMSMGACAGSAVLTPRTGSAAMALITAATEPYTYAAGFTAKNMFHHTEMTPISIGPNESLQSLVTVVNRMSFGGTDCSLPMLDALEKGIEADVFVIYTDNETWAGRIHPTQALARYRKETGIPAKLVVVGMTSTGFSIADPSDAGMLDVVGFDASAPRIISDFS